MDELIELKDIVIECQDCKSKSTAQEINDDVERYFSMTKKSFVKFPAKGVKKDTLEKIVDWRLICELCHAKEYE
jgi:Zn finger protein HypA/HybF involved in hydrogenase expression